MTKIYINGEEQSLEAGENLQALLERLNIKAERGVAVAVNEDVIPQPQWAECLLQESDRVLLITAAQGG